MEIITTTTIDSSDDSGCIGSASPIENFNLSLLTEDSSPKMYFP